MVLTNNRVLKNSEDNMSNDFNKKAFMEVSLNALAGQELSKEQKDLMLEFHRRNHSEKREKHFDKIGIRGK